MTRTKSWTTRDPETVFCFLSRKWDPHVLQDLDALGQKKVHEFQDLSCEEATVARSPGLGMQTRVLGISIDVLNVTTLH
jgi:hypothetical protein